MYLLDTNVISALAPTRAAPPAFIQWLETHSNELFLSVVTIAEIDSGIAKCRRDHVVRKAAALAEWLQAILHLYADTILNFDLATARIAGALIDRARGAGHDPDFADIIIAATAQQHSLTILTRNLCHFAPLGVPAFDPLIDLP